VTTLNARREALVLAGYLRDNIPTEVKYFWKDSIWRRVGRGAVSSLTVKSVRRKHAFRWRTSTNLQHSELFSVVALESLVR